MTIRRRSPSGDVHVARMAERAASAARHQSRTCACRRADPFALRYVAATAMAMALSVRDARPRV
jgi:hypothetical protein